MITTSFTTAKKCRYWNRSSWYRSKRRAMRARRSSFISRNRRRSLNKRRSWPELSCCDSSSAPAGGHGTQQTPLTHANHEVDGQTRHDVDAQPRARVLPRDGPRLVNHALLVIRVDVAGVEVEHDVHVEVDVDEQVHHVPRPFRGLPVPDAERHHHRDVEQDRRLRQVPLASNPAFGSIEYQRLRYRSTFPTIAFSDSARMPFESTALAYSVMRACVGSSFEESSELSASPVPLPGGPR